MKDLQMKCDRESGLVFEMEAQSLPLMTHNMCSWVPSLAPVLYILSAHSVTVKTFVILNQCCHLLGNTQPAVAEKTKAGIIANV